MAKLSATVMVNGKVLQADLSQGHCLAIPLDHTRPQPNAYHAPLYEASPVKVGHWTGDTRHGAPVNFYNLRLNPHGNGTHTECVGHISTERYAIHESLGDGFWIAQVITVYPETQENGDRIIRQLEWEAGIEALIIRTMPNHEDKMTRLYGGTNPPYLNPTLLERMANEGILHLLLDLPSVDREEDGGVLAAHKAFWRYPEDIRLSATITEMVYVADHIQDGVYLLQIQLPALMLDASPSRPYIYPLV